MRVNFEGDKCANCNEEIGEIPIGDTKHTYYICEYCDSALFDNSIESKGLKPKVKTEIILTEVKNKRVGKMEIKL